MMKQKPKTLEELAEVFDSKITMVNEKRQLVTATDETCLDLATAVEKNITDLKIILALMRSELSLHREALNKVQELKKDNVVRTINIEHMMQNLPRHLPKMAVPEFHPQSKSKKTETTKPPSDPPKRKGYVDSPDSIDNKRSRARVTAATPVPSTDAIKRSGHAIQFLDTPSVTYITVEEFNVIPKYMKGRNSYDQINHTIDELNKAVIAKYKVLQTPKSRQNEWTKRHIREYKQQETNDTKGQHFIIDKDITAHSNMKLDNVGRVMLTMLRHCKRLREVRGKGLTRYVLIPRDTM